MSLDVFGEHSGAAEETRTPDPIITNDVLYQLSYSGTFWSGRPRGSAGRCQYGLRGMQGVAQMAGAGGSV